MPGLLTCADLCASLFAAASNCVAAIVNRLRTRLVKLGCIIAEPGMLGDKAISVLRLVKPFKLQVPVVVDSDADGDREAAAGMDDEGGDAEGGDDEEAAGGEGGAAGGGGARKMLAEVGRDQLLLEMICEVRRCMKLPEQASSSSVTFCE